MFSEKYNMRRAPLVLGLGVLLASQILFMLAPNYIVMVIARVIQGISSALVWVVGLALLCVRPAPLRRRELTGLL
jgi:predicted MFS family arabinose efflux permease